MNLCLRAPRLSELGFVHGFSMRKGGVSAPPFLSLNLGLRLGDPESAVLENHRRLAADIDYRPESLWEVQQVHGTGLIVAGPGAERGQEADGIVATSQGTVVAVRTADCLPLVLADPKSGAVAAVHGGWRGVVAGIVDRSVDTLCQASGSRPEQLVAAIFPHIGPCCFEIGENVAVELAKVSAVGVVNKPGAPRPFGDLATAVRLQLSAAGLPLANVEQVPGCTACDATRFFSYRRDGAEAGRHLTVVKAGISR